MPNGIVNESGRLGWQQVGNASALLPQGNSNWFRGGLDVGVSKTVTK